jgi:hypothetical protein
MKKSIAIIVVCMFCFSSCDPFGDWETVIWVENKSSIPVHFVFSETYPDTSLPKTWGYVNNLPPKDKKYAEFGRRTYNEIFKSLPADTLSLFIISSDTLAKYTWDEIKSGYKILKRYEISKADLGRYKNTITYQ